MPDINADEVRRNIDETGQDFDGTFARMLADLQSLRPQTYGLGVLLDDANLPDGESVGLETAIFDLVAKLDAVAAVVKLAAETRPVGWWADKRPAFASAV